MVKRATQMTALAAVAALALAACGSAPEEGGATGTAGGSESSFKACMVSDAGGFDDKSFNESGYNGLMAAEKNLGIQTATAESKEESNFAPNIDNLVSENCNVIVTVGFLLATATGDAAQANPDVDFAIVDSTAQDADGNTIELDNVKPISFDTAQASFLAGYLAAGMSKTGTVATYGGLQIPSVTIFMDGFVDGVANYNETHGTDVKTLGWNKDSQNGSFAGGFEDQSQGQQLTQTFIDQGADIIMPVAGPVGVGTLAAAKDATDVSVIWVDADGFETNPDSGDLILTSVLKEIGAGVEDVITAASEDEFSNEPYVGTLENGGVDIAPYHDFDSKVPQELKDEIDQLRKDIIDGTIVVESPSSP
ncbi:BMP family ABC transporter substrate-binding protein [Oerskovia sp. Sa4CUA1]|jgi:basic membrane protein A|uniref:BMP family ABC transporter substrate-binding protein n=1 Tax=Oerskovia rustica TaxID=2762237 RepID=A0ABR8RN20_9CELL|nr:MULTISPECIES: BMP family ABC transporter substrate-binding protein [Oerskovia]MBD7949156.1 BMP family ABC transporter substrate-binding protein [Oerskovia rustica]QDW63913.1 BMP family ABC transporter substrate-binding protein [Oerskovia sp. KBS0722]